MPQVSGDAALNVGFFVLHTAWIALTCLGWIWRRTRAWQLAAVSATALSWVALGFWYGWGYCPFTDWHWHVRARLGYRDPPSYVQLLIRELTGADIGARAADTLAVVALGVAALLGIVMTMRDRTLMIRGTSDRRAARHLR
jgi:hypothetical protein